MFEKLSSFMKGVMGMNADAYSKMGVQNPINSEMETALTTWIDLYKGDAPWLARNKQSLKLPSRIAESLATTVTVEAKIEVTGSQRAELINQIITDMMADLPANVEYGAAMGGIAFKPYFDGNEIAIDYVQADDFYPVAFTSKKEITAAMFVERLIRGDKVYSRVEFHNMEGDKCTIQNKAFVGRMIDDYGFEIPLSQIPEWAEIQPELTLTGMTAPLFAYMRIPFGNKIDPKSPLGVSAYADAIDLIKEADIQFQRLLWEYEGSELAIDANEDAFEADFKGDPVLPVGRERLYRVNRFDPKQMSGGELIKTFSPAIRDEAYIRGLNELMKQIEDKVGLARGTLSDPKDNVRTGDEVRSNRQKTYITIVTIQRALEKAIKGLVSAIDELMTLYNIAPAGLIQVNCAWDDSVITDPDVERERDRQEVREGIMAAWQYRAKWYGETEEVAKAAIAEIKQEEIDDNKLMGFDEQ